MTQKSKQIKKSFLGDFLKGQRDCKLGAVHRDQGEDYNRGYSAQYTAEQVASASWLLDRR